MTNYTLFKCVSASTVVVTCWLKPTYNPGREFVLLGKRSEKSDAFPGFYCLPGGMKDEGETLQETAKRELFEETQLDIPLNKFSFVTMYSGPNLDPRGEIISSLWWVNLGDLDKVPTIKGSDDLSEAKWVTYDEALGTNLAFNHNQMLKDVY